MWHRYARSIVRQAGYWILGIAVLAMVLSSWLAMLPMSLDTGGSSFRVQSQEGEISDAMVEAERVTVYNRNKAELGRQDQQSVGIGSISLLWESTDGSDMLTEERLKRVQQLEAKYQALPGWDTVCLRASNSTACSDALTVTSYMFPTVGANATVEYDGAGSYNPTIGHNVLGAVTSLRRTFVVADYDAADSRESPVIRTMLMLGGPLAGFTNALDQPDEQEELIDAWAEGMLEVLKQDAYADPDFRVLWVGTGVTSAEVSELIIGDGMLALISVVFVVAYILFHTRSPFLAAAGTVHVLLSLPLGLFIFRVVIGIGYFNTLNFLSIFILLGIGADDIFILLDAWKQSELEPPAISSTIEARMAWTLSRAVKSMLVSSTTTAAAFFANSFSTIPPIRNFGIFTGCLVVFNFLLVITWFPAWVVVRERLLRYGIRSLCAPLASVKGAQRAGNARRASQYSNEADGKDAEKQKPGFSALRKKKPELRLLEKVFANRVAPFVFEQRKSILVFFVILMAVSAGLASQIKPAEDSSVFLPEDNNMQHAIDLMTESFFSTSLTPMVFVTWGIGSTDGVYVDRSVADKNDPTDFGDVVWDATFDPSSTAAQTFLLDSCYAMRNLTSVRDGEVQCIIEDVMNHRLDNNQTWPVPPEDFIAVLANVTQMLDEEQPNASEFAFGSSTSASRSFRSFVGWDDDTGDLRYIKYICNTTFPRTLAAKDMRPHYEQFQALIDGRNAAAAADPATLGVARGIQGSDRWVKMRTEVVLVELAFVGAGISLVASFFVILLATRNFNVASTATLAILGSVLGVLAIMVLLDWRLGVIQSICLTIVVGLSVDYIIHFAGAFNESPHATRFLRVQQALRDMGISVFSAGVTTFGAAFVLFFTTVLFFVAFGNFIAMVVALSQLYATFFLFAGLSIWGPTAVPTSLTMSLRSLPRADSGSKVSIAPAGSSAG